MSRRSIKLYIQDVKEAITKIEKYTKDMDFESFKKDSKTVDAVVRNLAVIGEAVKSFPEEVRIKYPQVAWKQIAGTRDKVVHAYFEIDVDILWKTVTEDLPPFKKQISKMLQEYK